MISVCLASYNGERYIEKQVLSILRQLSCDDELIVSDDGSLDNTLLILRRIGDKRIKIFENKSIVSSHKYAKSHYKVSKNFENALCKASGDYIFLSDQDDVWEQNKVQTCLSELKNHEVVITNYAEIDGVDGLITSRFYKKSPIQSFFLLNWALMPFHGCCMAFRKTLLNEVLPFPHDLIMHDNWIGLYSCLQGYSICYIDIPLIQYRRHQSNVSFAPHKSKSPLWFRLKYRFVILAQLINRVLHIRLRFNKN